MQPLALSAALLTLVACQTTAEEVPVSTSLKPVQQPAAPKVGDVRVWLEDGKDELRSTVVAVDGEVNSFSLSNGCEFSTPKSGFGPTTTFNNCEGNTGTQDVTLSGSPWPLAVGATWAYEAKGSNVKGDTWEAKRTCEVEDEARITVPMGSYDTFKIVCDDRWRTRTYYFAPDVGMSVLFIRHHKRRNANWRLELVRVEAAQPES